MKKLIFLFTAFILVINVNAQTKSVDAKPKTFKYETVPNDPLNARIYTLANGLKVYMSVYKDSPRVQTYIAVKAGSKNDPADATGLAHYLEHMLFKGTDKYGSQDFSKEGPLVAKIEELFEVYRKTTDEKKRAELYHQIDSVSGVAAKSAIAQEYDKMLTSIGANGTNAYTSFEQTVYVNDIPSNQLEKWLTIEAERFRKPVLRLFHTELEAVYEEKNRGLDNDGRKVWEALFAGMFQKHTYGTQTTIGTVEHLKNPSMKEIRKYFETHYVPNNMAICLSGDFDPEQVIKMVDEKFGYMVTKEVPKFNPPVEAPITKPVIKEVFGPEAASLSLAFRFNGAASHEADMITLISKILYNQKAGLIDLNLNQSQKVLGAYSYDMALKDYSLHMFSGKAKEGQKLEDVKDLLLSQLEKVKKGEFPDWLMAAIVNDMKVERIEAMESNDSRADEFVSSFVLDIKWDKYLDKINRISKITKQEIVDFANRYYGENYVLVYKRTGEDKNVVKVTKPHITPVEVNSEIESEFVKSLINAPAKDIQPVFLDFQKDIQQLKVKGNVPVAYLKNKENDLFDMYYIFEMGNNHNKKLGLAIRYLSYLGTGKYAAAQIQEEFYKLGCSFSVFNSEDQVYVNLRGLNQNFDKAVELFEHLLSDAQVSKEPLENLVGDILKKRSDDKLSKRSILSSAMFNYGVYGKQSPFTNILSEAELKALNPEELVAIIKGLNGYDHKILYYGPADTDPLVQSLTKLHNSPAKLKIIPEPMKFVELENTDTQVYVVDYDMKQAEILMLSKGLKYNNDDIPVINLFNEYFGGGMSSVVFQEMRESRALAYSVYSYYKTPKNKDESYYIQAYIGTQADKLPEAMKGLFDLMNNMPKAEKKLDAAKKAGVESLRTERITKKDILFSYERAKKFGRDYDIRKDLYSKLPNLTMNDVAAFQQANLKDKKFTILVLGKKDNLDIAALEKYGKVKYLSLEDIFGY